MSNYRVESYGVLSIPNVVAWTPNRWLALKIRDLCQDRYIQGHRRETYVVSHPDSEGWIEWEDEEEGDE